MHDLRCRSATFGGRSRGARTRGLPVQGARGRLVSAGPGRTATTCRGRGPRGYARAPLSGPRSRAGCAEVVAGQGRLLVAGEVEPLSPRPRRASTQVPAPRPRRSDGDGSDGHQPGRRLHSGRPRPDCTTPSQTWPPIRYPPRQPPGPRDRLGHLRRRLRSGRAQHAGTATAQTPPNWPPRPAARKRRPTRPGPARPPRHVCVPVIPGPSAHPHRRPGRRTEARPPASRHPDTDPASRNDVRVPVLDGLAGRFTGVGWVVSRAPPRAALDAPVHVGSARRRRQRRAPSGRPPVTCARSACT